MDVLVVINYLRRQSGGTGEAEGSTPGVLITQPPVYLGNADGEAAPLTANQLSSPPEAPLADFLRFGQPPRSEDTISQFADSRLSDPVSLPRQLSRRRLLSSRAEERSLSLRELAFAEWSDIA
ncbi:MAG: hypothetical protein ACK53L_16605, partial [Pirellulaceae bacterium]